ncbi:MAG: hypothetical protein JXQ75_10180 [Phycisphaerae bacterium]|nr:hypothetical protein [Phycisphaerae bacterium]
MRTASVYRILALGLCCAFASASTCESFTLSLTFAVPERAEDTDSETAAMPDGAKLVVSNENGSTRVTVDPDATEATIEITRIALGDGQEEADALLADIVVTVTAPTTEDNTLYVDAPKPASATGTTGDLDFTLVDDELSITGIVNSRRVALVRLRITIPSGHAVEVMNDNGAIRAVSLDTDSKLEARNGSVRAMGATANLDIGTHNGQIVVEDNIGSVNIVSHNGQVIIEDHSGSIDAETRNGQLSIEVRALGAGQEILGRTHNGVVKLELPPDLSADLRAETENGIVAFDEEDFDNVTTTTHTVRKLVATLNDGGPTIDVATNNGLIRIDRN